MERGSYIPLLMAGICAAVVLIANLHGANVLAYEYKTASKLFNVLTWVFFGLASLAPFVGNFLSSRVKSDRGLTWMVIAFVAICLLLGMFSAYGFKTTFNNPYA